VNVAGDARPSLCFPFFSPIVRYCLAYLRCSAMVASEAAARKLQEQLDDALGSNGDMSGRLAEAEAQRDEVEWSNGLNWSMG